MVFKRPYAFLIKHFRLIHIIITAIFLYIATMTIDIYRYLNTVIDNTLNRYDVMMYIRYSIFLFIFIALALCIVVYLLLKYKNKPRRIYLITVIGYVAVGIYIYILYTYMHGFSNNLVDQKTIRVYRDILLIFQLYEFYTIFFMLIRGLGFDIKKFDFKSDLQELNASTEDSQEVEINTTIDTTDAKRLIRKHGRELGYYYKEYKMYIIAILTVVAVILGYKGYDYFDNKLKIYKENDTIGNVFRVTIKESYYYTDGNDNYVVVNFDISKTGTPKLFNSGLMTLAIARKKYTPDKNICGKFESLGTCYKRQYIRKNTENYILAYKVDRLYPSKTKIEYNESFDREYKVKLSLKEYMKND